MFYSEGKTLSKYIQSLLNLMNFDMLQQKIKKNTIQIGRKFDDLNRMFIIGGSRSEKINALYNLTNHQPDTDKINLYVKDPLEAKYQFLTSKRDSEFLIL